MNSNLKRLAIGLSVPPLTLWCAIGAYAINNRPASLSDTLLKPVVTIDDLGVDDPRNTYETEKRRRETNERLIAQLMKQVKNPAQFPEFSNARIYTAEEHECLAKNIYYEARKETLKGRVAIALVTLARTNSNTSRYPSDICGVVHQGGEDTLNRCQFSWYCDGHSDNPKEVGPWQDAQAIAEMILDPDTKIVDFTNGATHYHANYVSPCWATFMVKTAAVDEHIFYREFPTNDRCVPKTDPPPMTASL